MRCHWRIDGTQVMMRWHKRLAALTGPPWPPCCLCPSATHPCPAGPAAGSETEGHGERAGSALGFREVYLDGDGDEVRLGLLCQVWIAGLHVFGVWHGL